MGLRQKEQRAAAEEEECEGDARVKEEEGVRDSARGEKRAAGCAVRAGREVTAGCWRWRGQNREEHLSVQVAATAAAAETVAAVAAVLAAACVAFGAACETLPKL